MRFVETRSHIIHHFTFFISLLSVGKKIRCNDSDVKNATIIRVNSFRLRKYSFVFGVAYLENHVIRANS